LIKIDGKDVTKYILNQPAIPQEKRFIGSDFIVTNISIECDNVTGIFFAMNPLGIFWPTGYYNKIVEIIDDESGVTEWNGVIRNVSTNNTGGATIECFASLVVATESKLIYTSAGLAPAEHIFRILSGIIPQSKINSASFDDAKNYQLDLGVKLDVNYTLENEVSILSACQAIAELSLCNLFVVNDIIYLEQIKPFTNQSGIELNDDLILRETFQDGFEDENIINKYTVSFLNGTVQTATAQDDDSISRYGQVLPFEKDYSQGELILNCPIGAVRRLYDTLFQIYSDAKHRIEFNTDDRLRDRTILENFKFIDAERGISAVYKIYRKEYDRMTETVKFLCYNYEDVL
jgi:hypothetical protein